MSDAAGKYHIWTVGCQMNMADSQRVAGILDGLGWEEVASADAANLVVLNTCSVREQPEKRAHGQLSLLKHAKRQRRDLLVAMMGCMIGNARQREELKHKYPVVDLFFKVEQADILPRFLAERWAPGTGTGCVDIADLGAPRTIGGAARLPLAPAALPAAPEPIPTSRLDGSPAPMAADFRPGARELHYPAAAAAALPAHTPTAWLPVVLGCNKVCSYCIVPSRRGRERSRPITELMDEAIHLVEGGARELTLLGQTVEAYGLDLPQQHADLGDLMAALSEIGGLERIRFMTSYPPHMTPKMIRQMAALPKVCEHVNIPVQHGDDDMLRRMRRGYSLRDYRELIGLLRQEWPGVSLSTDVIVGFCGETEQEFQHTLDLLEEIRFDVVHVAAYSPRPGTLAYKWPDDVPLAEKKRRLQAVEAVQERIAREINEGYVGRTEEVLIETHQVAGGQHQWRGRTRTNKLVFLPAVRAADGAAFPAVRLPRDSAGGNGHRDDAPMPREIGPGMLVPAAIEKATAWSLQGRSTAR